MKVIQISAEQRTALLAAQSNEQPRPMSSMAETVLNATNVWNWLHKDRETPPSVLKAFDDICEQLNVPYVIDVTTAES